MKGSGGWTKNAIGGVVKRGQILNIYEGRTSQCVFSDRLDTCYKKEKAKMTRELELPPTEKGKTGWTSWGEVGRRQEFSFEHAMPEIPTGH